METKISVLRQFGSEQFSMSITHDTAPSDKQIKEAVAQLGVGITEAFDKVMAREESEKQKLTAASAQREATNKAAAAQIKAEMESATKAKQVVRDAEALNRRNSK